MFGKLLIRLLSHPEVTVIKRHAGHSKWANIRHVKSQKDSERSKMFERFAHRIRLAVQEGGSADPTLNLQLAQVIDLAKKNNMPVSTIQNSIKNAQMNKTNTEMALYEIKGPKGAMIIAYALTSHPKKTKETIATILRKNGTSFADHGARHMFEHKGVILAIPPPGLDNREEATVDHAIESGAEEVSPSEVEEGVFKFICEMGIMKKVESSLEKLDYTIKEADYDLIPKTEVSLSDIELQAVSKLYDKLEELPEIVRIYDNIS